MSVEAKIDKLTGLVQDQSEDIAKITMVLGGSGMGDKGLVEQMQELRSGHYKSKQEINKLKWIASGIATLISGIWAGLITWWNS